MDLAVIGLAFVAIFVVELPDKTFLATLVLATKYRGLYVWIGVGIAFAIQTGLAVAVGGVASLLDPDIVHVLAGLLFLGGAVILFKEGRGHHAGDEEETQEEYAAKARPANGLRQVLASFMVLFAAEWGDLSQLLTISLVARHGEPVGIFIGALGALLVVSGLAVVLGQQLLRRVKLHVLHYVGAAICLGLGLFTLGEVVLG